MDWNERETSLRFMLGEIPLFRLRLRVLRLDAHFTELGDDPDGLLPRLLDLPEHLAGLLVRGHPIGREYPALTRLPGAIRYVPAQYQHFYADMTLTYEEFLNRMSKFNRQEKRRRTRRYCEQNGGRLDLREYRTPEAMEEFHRLARELSAKTYQERLLHVGFPDTPEMLSRLREQASRDEARGFMLFLGGRPAAYSYACIRDGIVLAQYLGYDPQYRKLGVGSVLQFNLLERLFAEGRFRMYDHGQGGGDHKESLATGSVRCADIFYLRPSLRLGATVRLHRGLELFSAATGKALAATGVKELVKKALRRAA